MLCTHEQHIVCCSLHRAVFVHLFASCLVAVIIVIIVIIIISSSLQTPLVSLSIQGLPLLLNNVQASARLLHVFCRFVATKLDHRLPPPSSCACAFPLLLILYMLMCVCVCLPALFTLCISSLLFTFPSRLRSPLCSFVWSALFFQLPTPKCTWLIPFSLTAAVGRLL